MTPAVSIALLLLSATVVKSWWSLEDQTEAEGDFSSQFKQHVRKGASCIIYQAEKMQRRSSGKKCLTCTTFVTKVQRKLGGNQLKEEIKKQVDRFCNEPGLLRQTCKDIIKESKDILIDGIAKGWNPENLCDELSYC